MVVAGVIGDMVIYRTDHNNLYVQAGMGWGVIEEIYHHNTNKTKYRCELANTGGIVQYFDSQEAALAWASMALRT